MHASFRAATCGLLLLVTAVRCDLNVAVPWEHSDLRLLANETGGAEYVPDNNLAFRIRIWMDTAYVVVPRFRPGVPATLCATSARDGGPLRPFPTLGLQTLGNCIGLQHAVELEIDHLGQLWTLDRGRTAYYDADGGDGYACDPKLFVVDAATGHVVRSAVMPPAVYTVGRSVLSGLALDLKTLTAVVADVGPDRPGFITYDFRSGIFRKFPCAALARRRSPKPTAPVDNATTTSATAATSDHDDDDDDYDEVLLAASPIDDQLYFTAVKLDAVYALPLSVFAAPPLAGHDISHYASARGPKNGTATAAIMDTAGNLFVAMPAGHKVVTWNTLRHGFDALQLAVREVRLDWVTGLAFDAHGYLWILSSAFRDFRHAGAAANAQIFRRYCGTTTFALQEVAANFTDDDHNAAHQPNGRNAATTQSHALAALVAVATVLLKTLKTTRDL